jgi:proline iminopeptidase
MRLPGLFQCGVLTWALIASSLTAGAPTSQPAASSDPADLEKLGQVFEFLRSRNARDYAVSGPNAPNAIEESRFIELGGIPQWVTIRGEDRRNPVLLVLHGGPGDATSPWGWAVLRTWCSAFTVVQWDQRGTGRTLSRNGPPPAATLNLDQLTHDGVELVEQLRTLLQTNKVIALGHSFGSILGGRIAKARPDLLLALVGTGQVADSQRNYAVAYQGLLAKAERLRDVRALAELRDVGPPPYADGRGFGVQRKWSNLFEGADVFLSSTLGLALMAPGATLRDANAWLDGQGISAEALVPETSRLSAEALAGEFKIPVIVIQGAEDFTTPTSLAAEFVRRLRAPSKTFVTIDGGHFAVFMHPDRFLQELKPRVMNLK